MTKVAALAPALMAMSPAMAAGIGLAATGVGTALQYRDQRQHQKRQDAANNSWINFQNQKSAEFDAQDDRNRQLAQAELSRNLDQSGGDTRMETINAETDRLTEDYTAGMPDISQEALTAGGPDKSEIFDTALSNSVGNATAEARKRIQAMAKATAYGGGSMGSMGMNDMLRNQGTANAVGGINDGRMGDINTLRRYQSIQPEMLRFDQGAAAPILNAAGQFAMGGGLQGLGETMAGWGTNLAPKSSLIPPVRPTFAAAPAMSGSAFAPTPNPHTR